MPIAVNDKGEAVALKNGKWVRATVAENEAGHRMAQDPDTGEWVSLPTQTWGQTLKSAVDPTTILHSGEQAASDIYSAVRHPGETTKGIAYTLEGAGQLVTDALGITLPAEHKNDRRIYAQMIGKLFMDRYGSVEALKHTIATDPVGFLSDASTVIGGGGVALRGAELAGKVSGAAKVASAAGKAADVAKATSAYVNPVTLAGKAAGLAGKGIYRAGTDVYGVATGTTGEPIRQAVSAAANRFADPARYKAFVDAFTGATAPEETASYAQKAVSELIQKRGKIYQQEMAKVKLNQTPLPFQDIDDALIDALNDHTVITKSGVRLTKNPLSEKAVQAVEEVLSEFRKLPPDDFTVEIADAMKQKLQQLAERPEFQDQFGRANSGGHVINSVTRAVRDTINAKSPEYGKVMMAYQTATDDLKQVQRELSLGKDANAGMTLRKLSSGLRNNVSSAYAHRGKLIEFLQDNGAPNLGAMLSGMALGETTSRGGMGRLFTALGAGEALSGKGLVAAAGLAATSPRLAGHAARIAGTGVALAKEPARLAGKLPGAVPLTEAWLRTPQARGRWLNRPLPQEPLSGADKSALSGDSELTGPKLAGVKPGVNVEVKPFREGLPAPATASQMRALPPPATPPGGAEDTVGAGGTRG